MRTIQRILLTDSALLVAAAFAVSGITGFIGLVMPHLIISMWLGVDHRATIPGCVLAQLWDKNAPRSWLFLDEPNLPQRWISSTNSTYYDC